MNLFTRAKTFSFRTHVSLMNLRKFLVRQPSASWKHRDPLSLECLGFGPGGFTPSTRPWRAHLLLVEQLEGRIVMSSPSILPAGTASIIQTILGQTISLIQRSRIVSWKKWIKSLGAHTAPIRKNPTRPARPQLWIEALEDRSLPSVSVLGNGVIAALPQNVSEHYNQTGPMLVVSPESQQRVLTQSVTVDRLSPGSHGPESFVGANSGLGASSYYSLGGSILVGTLVNSYYVRLDNPSATVRATATLIFIGESMVGISYESGTLDGNDGPLGLVGVTYGHGEPSRGAEIDTPDYGDGIIVYNTHQVTLSFTVGPHQDVARIITTNDINQVADLAISKTHSGNFIQGDPGDNYTVSVSNSGSGSTSGQVSVTDTVPTGETPTGASGNGWATTISGQTVTATRSDALAAGGSYPALTVTVSVSATAPATVTNTATVSGGGETNTSNDSATDPTTIVQVADLTITKTHAGDFAQGDSADSYTIAVTNNGSGSSSGTVTVTDTLPPGLTLVGATGMGWTLNTSGQTVTGTRSDVLAAGGSYPPITLTVSVADSAPAAVTNTASVSGGGEVVTSNDSASDPTTIVQEPDLSITKSHSGNFAEGDPADMYTIMVTNVGFASTNGTVTVTDNVPGGLTPTAVSGNGWTTSINGQTVTAARSDALATSGSYPPLTVTVSVANNAVPSLTNTATVSGGGEINAADDAASDPTTIGQLPDLTITKHHAGNFRAGDAADTYTISVNNAGGAPTDGSTVTVTDTLPTGLMPTAADTGALNGWILSTSGQTITARRSDTVAGGSSYAPLTITVSVTSNAPATVTNTATVSGGGETDTSNDTASDPTAIDQVADLTLTKTHAGDFAQGDLGDTYTITVTNSGAGQTNGSTVTVTDTVPAGETPTLASGTGWTTSINGQAVTGTRSDVLAAGGSYPPITLTVSVADNAPATVTNTASVSGGGEVVTSNDTASDPTSILPGSKTTTTVSSSQNPSAPGQVVTFTATVTNTSGSGAPTGSVEVFDDTTGVDLGTGIPGPGTSSTATWALATSNLAPGTANAIRAVYTHTGFFQDSFGTTTQTVAAVGQPVIEGITYLASATISDPTDNATFNTGQKSIIRYVRITFNETVNLGAGAVTAHKDSGPGGVSDTGYVTPAVFSAVTMGSQYVVTYAFSPGSLIEYGSLTDGNYTLTVHAMAVTNGSYTLSGGDHMESFWRFYGDSNGDRVVDNFDGTAFNAAYRSRQGFTANYRAYFDFNGDGYVDATDYYQFLRRRNADGKNNPHGYKLNADGSVTPVP
jgi:uncharacterized repeat protein (TIGR01451 family)